MAPLPSVVLAPVMRSLVCVTERKNQIETILDDHLVAGRIGESYQESYVSGLFI